MRFPLRRLLPLAALVPVVLYAVAGCGEKIAIPQPKGLFSVSAYGLYDQYHIDDPRQVAVRSGVLFVLTGEGLSRRNLNFEQQGATVALTDPTALCLEDTIVFVWDDAEARLSWYLAQDLTPMGQTLLPGNGRVEAMATCAAGIDQVPGAGTYLYMSVPDSGVVRRYAFHEFSGPEPHGILTRSDGQGARFVHQAAGLALDSGDRLLVCDADPGRNWVIRFDATPDETDLATEPDQPDPLRGRAVLFRAPECNPPAADEYTLGDAPACNEDDWVGGPSTVPGEFDGALALAVDGSGRIFVADTGNDRVQIFAADGYFDFLFGKTETSPGPLSIAVSDYRWGVAADNFNYAAWVFLVIPGTDEVRKFISSEHNLYLNQQPLPGD